MSAMQFADKTVFMYSYCMFISVTPLRKNGFRREQRELRADAQICGDFCIESRPQKRARRQSFASGV